MPDVLCSTVIEALLPAVAAKVRVRPVLAVLMVSAVLKSKVALLAVV